MPSIGGNHSRGSNVSVRDRKSIICIASHAYKKKLAESKEQRYATSFQKSEEYIEQLREEVNAAVFRDTVESSVTPGYVFEELRGVYHTAEHPLISKGLLASSKREQYGRQATANPVWPHNRPRPQTAGSRSFYRPNTTHNYLSKTVTLQGTHDGFNPRLGTPTRAQLLRNRVRFTSAPDLTYSYLANRTIDGKHEAVYKKNKLEEEALQLKASKIEMDRMASKYRKFMLGSQYTNKWVESHTKVVHGLVAVKNRPASSVTNRPANSRIERRAVSAMPNTRHTRAEDNSTHGKIGHTDVHAAVSRQTFPTPGRKTPSRVACLNDDTKSRAANLVPYTAPMNSPGRRECTDPAIIIKSAADLNTEQQNEVFSRKLESAHRMRLKIEKGNVSPASSPAMASPRPTSASNSKSAKVQQAAEKPEDSAFFVTTPGDDQIPLTSTPEPVDVISVEEDDHKVNNERGAEADPQPNNHETHPNTDLQPDITNGEELDDGNGRSKTGDSTEGGVSVEKKSVSMELPVSVEMPVVENTSGTLSPTVDLDNNTGDNRDDVTAQPTENVTADHVEVKPNKESIKNEQT